MEQTNMAVVCSILYIITNCNVTATNHVTQIRNVNLARKFVSILFCSTRMRQLL